MDSVNLKTDYMMLGGESGGADREGIETEELEDTFDQNTQMHV